MLSIASASAKPASAFRYLSSEEYYSEGEHLRGEWHGKAAAAFGLAGAVARQAFERLHEGLHPVTGKPLVQRPPNKPHHPGWDFTFSAPKSVSVLWALAPPETRKTIEACHAAAVRSALDELERGYILTKRGKGGAHTEHVAGIAASLYRHVTSRELDPQLHTHAFVMNIALRFDGSTGAVLSKPAFEQKLALGTFYRAALAAGLTNELAVRLRPTKDGFEVDGIPQRALDAFSKRRAQITNALDVARRSGGKAAAAATLKTRRPKQRAGRETLFAAWRETAAGLGLTPELVAAVLNAAPRSAAERAEPELAAAPEGPFTRDQLVAASEPQALSRGWSTNMLSRAVDGFLTALRDAIPLGTEKRRALFASSETASHIDALTRAVISGLQRPAPPVSPGQLSAAARNVENSRSVAMTDEQRKALRRVAAAEAAVHILRGLPGTGKSLVIEAAVQAWESAGLEVRTAAMRREGAALLAERAGAASSTVHRVLADLGSRDHARSPAATAAWLLKRGPARAALEASADRFRASSKTVLVIERASEVPLKDLAFITRAVIEAGGRLVLVDHERRPGWRGTLGSLDRFISTSVLRERFRLAPEAERLRLFYGIGVERPGPTFSAPRPNLFVADRGDAKDLLVGLWRDSVGASRHADHLITALDARDLADLNERARRAHLGSWGLRSAATSTPLLPRAIYYGQRVRLLATVQKWGIRAGEFGTVARRDRKHGPGWIAVKLDRGATVHLHSSYYSKHLGPGYAVDPRTVEGRDLKNVLFYFRPRPFSGHRLRELIGQASDSVRVVAEHEHRAAAETVMREAEAPYRQAAAIPKRPEETQSQQITPKPVEEEHRERHFEKRR